jgi:purine-nucleoside phosphorylase
MKYMYNKALKSADYIMNKTIYLNYYVAIILGSYLGKLIDTLQEKEYVYCKDN